MTINRSNLTASSIVTDNTEVVIEMLQEKPPLGVVLNPPELANKLVGYYNQKTGFVELYLTDGTGSRYSRVS